MNIIKQLAKEYKSQGRTEVKLNLKSTEIQKEVAQLMLEDMATLTEENAKDGILVVNAANPEWGCKGLNKTSSGWATGRGCNSSMLHEGAFKFWKVCDKATTKDAHYAVFNNDLLAD